MYLHEHLEKLRYFYEVAKLGSMKRASESIFITQPSLSKSIKTLEDVVGKQLFIRLPRGVRLSNEGEILFQYCKELFSSLEDLERKIAVSDDPMAGVLRIGTYDSIATYYWPRFLKMFLPKYPNLTVELKTGRSKEIGDLLEAGELDLVLIVSPHESATTIVKNLCTEFFRFYESSNTKKIYNDLKSAPLIMMPESFGSGDSLKSNLIKLKLQNHQVYTTSSLESVKELTLNGIGIGLLPERLARSMGNNLQLSKLSNKKLFPHNIGLAYQKHKNKSEIFKTIMREISETF